MALAARASGRDYRTFVLMSDGEMQEGMTWEAAMAAAHFRVGSLTVIVDRNRLQVDGWVRDVMEIEPLSAKWRAFGWSVLEADGNDPVDVLRALEDRHALPSGRPAAIICRTTKGRGVSFMENVMEWHGGTLSEELYRQAMAELAD
jgi:transketolase